MKIGVQVLLYNVDRFILPMLENCGPHVDRIYVTWSRMPWSAYNHSARRHFHNMTSPDILQKSRFREKITLITGEWLDESSQRNAALERAKDDLMDFLIVQDADEFYTSIGYQQNIAFMRANPETPYFRAKWLVFWKTTRFVVDYGPPQGIIANCENYAVNCRMPVRFSRIRGVDAKLSHSRQVPALCYHLSWVQSDDEVWQKISTWGHAPEVSAGDWFERKWRHWEPSTRFINPQRPSAAARRAIPYNGDLPEVLREFPDPPLVFLPVSYWEKAWWSLLELREWVLFSLRNAALPFYSWWLRRKQKEL